MHIYQLTFLVTAKENPKGYMTVNYNHPCEQRHPESCLPESSGTVGICGFSEEG